MASAPKPKLYKGALPTKELPAEPPAVDPLTLDSHLETVPELCLSGASKRPQRLRPCIASSQFPGSVAASSCLNGVALLNEDCTDLITAVRARASVDEPIITKTQHSRRPTTASPPLAMNAPAAGPW
ncbi:hypothetical protein ACJZ2D_007418 [Fusarium nematophilum]